MRENRTSGSVRGAPGNGRSYRESCIDMNDKDKKLQVLTEVTDFYLSSRGGAKIGVTRR